MAKGGLKTVFKDPVVPTSSGASDLELQGSAKLAGGDFEINGQKPVILVGEGDLNSVLKEWE